MSTTTVQHRTHLVCCIVICRHIKYYYLLCNHLSLFVLYMVCLWSIWQKENFHRLKHCLSSFVISSVNVSWWTEYYGHFHLKFLTSSYSFSHSYSTVTKTQKNTDMKVHIERWIHIKKIITWKLNSEALQLWKKQQQKTRQDRCVPALTRNNRGHRRLWSCSSFRRRQWSR